MTLMGRTPTNSAAERERTVGQSTSRAWQVKKRDSALGSEGTGEDPDSKVSAERGGTIGGKSEVVKEVVGVDGIDERGPARTATNVSSARRATPV